MEDEERGAPIAAPRTGSAASPSTDAADMPPVRRFRAGIWRWLAWTLGFSVLGAAVAVGVVFYTAPPPPSMGGTASLRNADNPGLIAFQIDKQRQDMVVFASIPAPPAGKDYQLWVQQPGRKPISLGILKIGVRDTSPLPAGVGDILSRGAPMNVSLEAASGAPGGLPTGPAVFHGYFTLMKEPVDERK